MRDGEHVLESARTLRAPLTGAHVVQLEPETPSAAIGAAWVKRPLDEALLLDASSWEQNDAIATSPFQRKGWYAAWRNVATADERGSAFVLARTGGDESLREIVPLSARRRRFAFAAASVLTWASDDVGCPDHLDLPLAGSEGLQELAGSLLALDWDVFALGNLRDDAAWSRQLATLLSRAGCYVSTRLLERCPFIGLPATWEDYLATQSSSRRQTIRRKERKLAREFSVVVRDHDAATFEEGWRALNALHSERWSGVTAFSPDVAEMHRVFARSLAECGALWLTTMELDGAPAAAWYGFTEGDTVFFFQSGRSNEHQQHSVGQVLMGMMIRRAIERGFRRFDFLRGDEPYKASWTSSQRLTWELVVTRPGLRGSWVRGGLFAQRMSRRARAIAKRLLRAGLAFQRGRVPPAPQTADA